MITWTKDGIWDAYRAEAGVFNLRLEQASAGWRLLINGIGLDQGLRWGSLEEAKVGAAILALDWFRGAAKVCEASEPQSQLARVLAEIAAIGRALPSEHPARAKIAAILALF